MNNETKVKLDVEVRKKIQKRVLKLERFNYSQKEFSNTDMIKKIQKIIEEEVNK